VTTGAIPNSTRLVQGTVRDRPRGAQTAAANSKRLQNNAAWRTLASPELPETAIHILRNSFLLLAGSLSAGLVCLMENRWRALFALTANGVLAAATVSPYILLLLPSVTGDWVVIVRDDFPISRYVLRIIEAFGSGGWLPGLPWCLLGGAVVYGVFKGLVRPEQREKSDGSVDREWNRAFEPLLLVVGTISVLAYLMWLKVSTAEWYYLPLLGLWAFCIDSAIGTWSRRPGPCALKLAAALFLGIVQIPAAWQAANLRMTNVDLLAESVAALATENDLVVVKPWNYGITLQRYYHGAAPWICLPEVETTEVAGVLLHSDGYRAFKQAMMRKNPPRSRAVSDARNAASRRSRFCRRTHPTAAATSTPDSNAAGAEFTVWLEHRTLSGGMDTRVVLRTPGRRDGDASLASRSPATGQFAGECSGLSVAGRKSPW